ncbi:smooth muscle caldesmon [Planoprotostelium fungivorum]|uniref:Smooth muscle caldesmon n=1 Tax=Planoprotostelium fungivorum TaxID=1890364 RepID=A0A2P6NMP9_9EUKA|nr:smooth muscle caldesmon [Planoprotostelium fungivorum]
MRVKALYTWEAQHSHQISFAKDDTFEVTANEGGWWTGLFNGQKGIFPSNYVTVVDNSSATPIPASPTMSKKLGATIRRLQSQCGFRDNQGNETGRLGKNAPAETDLQPPETETTPQDTRPASISHPALLAVKPSLSRKDSSELDTRTERLISLTKGRASLKNRRPMSRNTSVNLADMFKPVEETTEDSDATSKIQKLEKLLREEKQKVAHEEEMAVNLRVERSSHKERIEKLELQLRVVEKEREELQVKLALNQHKEEKIQETTLAVATAEATLKKELSDLQRDNREIIRQSSLSLEETKKRLDEVTREYEKLKMEAVERQAGYAKTLEGSSADVQKLQIELSKLKEDMKEKQKQEEEREKKKIEETNEREKENEKKVNQYKAEAKELERQLESYQNRMSGSQKSEEQLQNHLDTTQRQYREAKEEIERTQKQYHEAKQDIDRIEKQCIEARESLTVLSKQYRETKDELEKTKGKLGEVSVERDQLRENQTRFEEERNTEKKRFQSEIELLKKEREDMLREKSVTSQKTLDRAKSDEETRSEWKRTEDKLRSELKSSTENYQTQKQERTDKVQSASENEKQLREEMKKLREQLTNVTNDLATQRKNASESEKSLREEHNQEIARLRSTSRTLDGNSVVDVTSDLKSKFDALQRQQLSEKSTYDEKTKKHERDVEKSEASRWKDSSRFLEANEGRREWENKYLGLEEKWNRQCEENRQLMAELSAERAKTRESPSTPSSLSSSASSPDKVKILETKLASERRSKAQLEGSVKKLEMEMIEFKGRMVGLLSLLEQRNLKRNGRLAEQASSRV